MATTEPWLLVTPEQYKNGWMEMRGVTPTHHTFSVIRRTDDGNYVVRNPALQILEEGKGQVQEVSGTVFKSED